MALQIVATVASASPLTLHFPADASGVNVPAQNVSGLTLADDDAVVVQVQGRGLLPQVTGRR